MIKKKTKGMMERPLDITNLRRETLDKPGTFNLEKGCEEGREIRLWIRSTDGQIEK